MSTTSPRGAPRKTLYSMRRLEKILGLRRERLLGCVEMLRIQAYDGPHDSVAVDEEGLEALKAALATLGLYRPDAPA